MLKWPPRLTSFPGLEILYLFVYLFLLSFFCVLPTFVSVRPVHTQILCVYRVNFRWRFFFWGGGCGGGRGLNTWIVLLVLHLTLSLQR